MFNKIKSKIIRRTQPSEGGIPVLTATKEGDRLIKALIDYKFKGQRSLSLVDRTREFIITKNVQKKIRKGTSNIRLAEENVKEPFIIFDKK